MLLLHLDAHDNSFVDLCHDRFLYFAFVQNRGLLILLKGSEHCPIFFLKLRFMKGFEHKSIAVARITQKLEIIWCFCINMADYLSTNITNRRLLRWKPHVWLDIYTHSEVFLINLKKFFYNFNIVAVWIWDIMKCVSAGKKKGKIDPW